MLKLGFYEKQLILQELQENSTRTTLSFCYISLLRCIREECLFVFSTSNSDAISNIAQETQSCTFYTAIFQNRNKISKSSLSWRTHLVYWLCHLLQCYSWQQRREGTPALEITCSDFFQGCRIVFSMQNSILIHVTIPSSRLSSTSSLWQLKI